MYYLKTNDKNHENIKESSHPRDPNLRSSPHSFIPISYLPSISLTLSSPKTMDFLPMSPQLVCATEAFSAVVVTAWDGAVGVDSKVDRLHVPV
jgi:hypothetical protein